MLDRLNFRGEIAMNMGNQLLNQLIEEACKHPPGSPIRQRYLTQVIKAVSPHLWRENTPYYEDVLQDLWIYFLKNVCSVYDPALASIVSWLNYNLKWRLHDQRTLMQNRSMLEVSSGDIQANFNGIPAPDVSRVDGYEKRIEQLQQWIESHKGLRRVHIRDRPDINAKVLIQKRMLSETSWENLSRELGISIPTLSTFFRRKCLPLLREFSASVGSGEGEI